MQFQEQDQQQDQEKTFVQTSDRLLGRTMAGKYEVLQLLGKGGMSSVYKVKHLILGKVYAIKVMHQHLITDHNSLIRFKQEAAAASSLSHPNIITVHDFDSEGSLPYQAIDYLEGVSLSEEIKAHGKLEPMRAVNIFIQACSALAHAHSKGVIHRDLKPSNIMLIEKDGVKDIVKIVDFGIAKILPQEGEAVQQLTQTGEVFGSPFYMSPEQCLGNKLDARSDIYSMGCLMYETLTGHPPLQGKVVFETIQKHVDETPKSIKDELGSSRLLDELDAILVKALAKQAAQRYQTMDELLHELERIQQGQTSNIFSAVRRSMQVANIRMDPIKKRTPLQWVIPLLVTLSLLFVLGNSVLQMAQHVREYTKMDWPQFTMEAELAGFVGKNNANIATAQLVIDKLQQRANASHNSQKDPHIKAQYQFSLTEGFASNGNYHQAAINARELYDTLQILEKQQPAGQYLDLLPLMRPGWDRLRGSQQLFFIGDTCYRQHDYERALYFYHKAAWQLQGEALYQHQRISMKVGDCALQRDDFKEAKHQFLDAAHAGSTFPDSVFEIHDQVFDPDRATYMSKVGDLLYRTGDYQTAVKAYSAAVREWSKEDTEGFAGQASYQLALCYEQMKNLVAAEKALRDSAGYLGKIEKREASQNLPAVYKELAKVLYQEGKLFEANAADQQAISFSKK